MFWVRTAPWRPQPERESKSMKMELIQPFINAADAVLSQGLQGSTKVGNLTWKRTLTDAKAWRA